MGRALLLGICVLFVLGCGTDPGTPKQAATRLLELHGLLGKLPEQRTKDAKNTEVARPDLQALFSDLDKYDKFTGDLFVGVIVGALARHQSKMTEQINGETATLKAGEAVIHLAVVDGRWKINLDKTIPPHMKKAAKQEKARYDAAKEAGKALSGE